MITLTLLIPSVIALNVQGNILGPLNYEPGKNILNHYSVIDTDKNITVSLTGDLLEYVKIINQKNNEFDLSINFPQKLIEPGSYAFQLSVVEQPLENMGGASSLLSVNKRFTVEVYSDEKELSAALIAPHVNVGTPVPFQVQLTSRGYKNIDRVQAEITIYDSNNNKVGKISTSVLPLPALTSRTLTAIFETKNLLPGEYHALAVVTYDGKQKNTAPVIFKIGSMDILLKDYTKILQQGYSEFSMNITNNWGNELRQIYAIVYLQNQEILHTPSISLAPWEEGELKGLVKVELLPQNYSGKIQLFYESETKEIPIKVEIILPPSAASDSFSSGTIILILSITLLVILIIVIIIIYLWRRGDKNERDEIQ